MKDSDIVLYMLLDHGKDDIKKEIESYIKSLKSPASDWRHHENAVRLHEQFRGDLRIDVLYTVAILFDIKERAWTLIHKIMNTNPDFTPALVLRGFMEPCAFYWIARENCFPQNIDRLLKWFRKALKVTPNDWKIWYAMGTTCKPYWPGSDNNILFTAIEYLERALECGANHHRVFSELIHMYNGTNDITNLKRIAAMSLPYYIKIDETHIVKELNRILNDQEFNTYYFSDLYPAI